ncbi:CPBP family intramembrane glutamic endopeptidase [Sandaracinus amylolyticus]|uniref:CAAX prenyl protease 2/Lysostaphin resistance protein A-like domain-containing protein n=1 Tax=Sandaracinus amylolyticus TaxID=927083 RepID=A0A0F6SH38_9BACT|nr:CPBP family intramembrane glutamic endopeptidase [Sandaracinus amylolyticus]AKF09769.1 hypothetical protein DB32_006918 [Sandaracinus amylolyticus]
MSLPPQRSSRGDRIELVVVLLAAWAWPITSELLELTSSGLERRIHFSNETLLGLVLYELVVGGALLLFLRARGKRVSVSQLDASWLATGEGVLLWAVAMMASWLGMALLAGTSRGQSVAFHGAPSPVIAILLVLVNPVFEECLHLGFLQERLRASGPGFAIGASLMVRLLLHAYQGPLAVAAIVPMGVVLGLHHWHTRRLWPAIVAHAIADALALATLRPAIES